jgi:multidrug efflux pump subunit AcrB
MAFREHPVAKIRVTEFMQGPSGDPPIGIRITGSDLDKLQIYAQQVASIAENHLGIINLMNPVASNKTDLYFDINKDKALLLGVPVHQIDRTVRSFVNGQSIGRFRDLDAEEYEMVLRYDFDQKMTVEDFDKISIPSLSGHFVPLRDLADLRFKKAPSGISHHDRDRTVTISAELSEGFKLDQVIQEIKVDLDELVWSEGISYDFSGDLEKRSESFGGMGIASVLALLLIFGVLVIQFDSFSQPLIIFSALPLSIKFNCFS